MLWLLPFFGTSLSLYRQRTSPCDSTGLPLAIVYKTVLPSSGGGKSCGLQMQNSHLGRQDFRLFCGTDVCPITAAEWSFTSCLSKDFFACVWVRNPKSDFVTALHPS